MNLSGRITAHTFFTLGVRFVGGNSDCSPDRIFGRSENFRDHDPPHWYDFDGWE